MYYMHLGKQPYIAQSSGKRRKIPPGACSSQSPSCPLQQIEDFFSTRNHNYFFIGLKALIIWKDEDQNFSEALLRYTCLMPDVCLTGDETMSASSNGQPDCLTDSLFHVLCDDNPSDDNELQTSHTKGTIRKISLGNEPGHRLLDSPAPRLPNSQVPPSGNEYTLYPSHFFLG